MQITSQLALALSVLLGDYTEMLDALNTEREIQGMDPIKPDESAELARQELAAFRDIEASVRWDIDPTRSSLIDAIENAEDGEAERDARADLARYDAKHPRDDDALPSDALIAAGLRQLASLQAEDTSPRILLELVARRLTPSPAAA